MAQVHYTCEVCGTDFISGRVREGPKICGPCMDLRRTLKGLIKQGLSPKEILARANKILSPTANGESPWRWLSRWVRLFWVRLLRRSS